jgi:hypothetical protein
MLNLPPEFLERSRNLFLTCGQFESYERLRSVFMTPELQPFRVGLRRENNPADLVNSFLEFILDQELSGGIPVFPIFLVALRDLYPAGNNRRDQLTQLLDDVQNLTLPAQFRLSTQIQKNGQSSEASQLVRIPGASTVLTKSDSESLQNSGRVDFFVSYNRHDRNWAEWIAWQLENAGYTTVIQAWDFRPGGNFVTDMQKATTNSERTIAVLSPDYLASKFTQPEWNAAFALDPTGEKGLLLPVKVRECELTGLLPQIVHIDLTGLSADDANHALLSGVMRGRVKPTVPPTFPGRPEPEFPHNLANEKSSG